MTGTAELHPSMQEIERICSSFTRNLSGQTCVPSMWLRCLQNQHMATNNTTNSLSGNINETLILSLISIGSKRPREESFNSVNLSETASVKTTKTSLRSHYDTLMVVAVEEETKRSSLLPEEPVAKRKFSVDDDDAGPFSQFAFVARDTASNIDSSDVECTASSISDTNSSTLEKRQDNIIADDITTTTTSTSTFTDVIGESLEITTSKDNAPVTLYSRDADTVVKSVDEEDDEMMDIDDGHSVKSDSSTDFSKQEDVPIITDSVTDTNECGYEEQAKVIHEYTSYQPDEWCQEYCSSQSPEPISGTSEIILENSVIENEMNAESADEDVVTAEGSSHIIEDSVVQLPGELPDKTSDENISNDTLLCQSDESSNVSEEDLSDSETSQVVKDISVVGVNATTKLPQDYDVPPLPFLFQTQVGVNDTEPVETQIKPSRTDTQNEALIMLLNKPSARNQNGGTNRNIHNTPGESKTHTTRPDVLVDDSLDCTDDVDDSSKKKESTLLVEAQTSSKQTAYNSNVTTQRQDFTDVNRLMTVMASQGFDQLPIGMILEQDRLSVYGEDISVHGRDISLHGSAIFMDNDEDDIDFTSNF